MWKYAKDLRLAPHPPFREHVHVAVLAGR